MTTYTLKISKRKKIEAVLIKTIASGKKYLQLTGAITAAGPNGAINVYKNGNTFHCDYMQYCHSVNVKECTNIESAIDWLKEFLPKINH